MRHFERQQRWPMARVKTCNNVKQRNIFTHVRPISALRAWLMTQHRNIPKYSAVINLLRAHWCGMSFHILCDFIVYCSLDRGTISIRMHFYGRTLCYRVATACQLAIRKQKLAVSFSNNATTMINRHETFNRLLFERRMTCMTISLAIENCIESEWCKIRTGRRQPKSSDARR